MSARDRGPGRDLSITVTLGVAAAIGIGGTVFVSAAERSSPAETRAARGSAAAQKLAEVRRMLDGGRYTEAEARARALLADVEMEHSGDSLQAAEVMDVLVDAMLRGGKPKEPGVRDLAERAIRIKEKLLEPDHPDLATSLTNLGILLTEVGEYGEAGGRYERALAIQEKALGPDHPDLAWTLTHLGILLYWTGDAAGSKQVHERALAIRERVLGPEHRDVTWSLNNLAILESDRGNYIEARVLYERALRIREKTLGPEHPEVAGILNNLAILLDEMGDYARARRLYERAVAIREKTLGSWHPRLASTLHNLAALHLELGDYETARTLCERAVHIYEKAFGPEHPEVAVSLNSLADLLRETGERTEASLLYERSLAMQEKLLGPQHVEVAATLESLANLLRDAGDLTQARPLYDRALAIRENATGPEEPGMARTLDSLAALLHRAGDRAGARRLYERAVAIREKALGPNHPEIARTLNELAQLLLEAGQRAEALELALRAEAIATEHLRLTARALPERQALSYASTRTASLDLALSLIAQRPTPQWGRRVWDHLTRSRALVLEEMAARHREVTEITRLAAELASARERLANLVVRGPGRESPERYRAILDEARQQKEQAEMALAEKSLTFRQELTRQRISIDDLARSLPADSALVAFVLYNRHQGPTEKGQDSLSTASVPEPNRSVPRKRDPVPSYLAFVLPGGKPQPVVVPLGAAEEIDPLISGWQEEAARGLMRDGRFPMEAETACRRAGEALRRRIWDPLGPALAGAQRVFIVPDEALHLVNFYALPVGERDYLLEAGLLIHYLSAERDLVSLPPTSPGSEGLIALGAPAFDETALFAALSATRRRPEGDVALNVAAARAYRGEHSSCAGFRSIRFEPLPASERETEAIVALWERGASGPESEWAVRSAGGTLEGARTVLHLTGAAASEAEFKLKAPGRRVLHVATHGFFLGGRCRNPPEGSRGVGGLRPEGDREPTGVPPESPLLMAGLALAGANHRDAAAPDEEDGILTAEEIAAMDLGAAEWAVLSACDTGVGELKAGEGVLGLRRAFQMAGAETVIMSLWSVDDEAAREWMVALYQGRLLRSLGTAEAVREASLSLLRRQRERMSTGHPFYWAGFVAAGNWR